MADEAFDPNKYLAEKTAQTGRTPPALSDGFDPGKYLAEKTGAEEPGLLNKAVDYGVRGLDYLGGINRAGLVTLGDIKAMKHDPSHKFTVTGEDVGNIVQGHAPTSSEYLRRAGVSEGPSADLPLLGNTSLRDGEGLALDIATDPLMALTAAARGIPRLGKALNPIGSMAESAGTKVYKSGLKKVDEKLVERGAKPVSDLLLEEGKSGTTKTLAKESRELGKKALAERTELYAKAEKLGATVDMSTALTKAEAAVTKMRSNPGLAPAAEKLLALIDSYKKAGKVTLATASEWKTAMFEALPEAAFNQHGKVKGAAQKVEKALAQDFKTAIVDAGNSAEKGLGDEIHALNEKMQTTLGAEKPFKMQVARGNTTNAVTPVDAMLGTFSGLLSHDARMAAGAVALKKAADLSKTTYVRTKAGMGLLKAGKSGNLDTLARRGLIRGNAPSEGLLANPRGLLSGEE